MPLITCKNIAKRYIKEVLFREFSFEFESGNQYVILGPNSSGKSTLLKIIGGVLAPTKGRVVFENNSVPEELFSFSSPEMHLLDDFTVQETFELHFQFKKPLIPLKEQWELANLNPFLAKKYSNLSSGLKNKVKLSLALFTDAPALLLDEPCTNFDEANSNWYNEMIERFWLKKLVVVASNQEIEYKFCKEKILLQHYKEN
jgi:ABC-type multidrug transport system ATPase subunit